MLFFNSQLSAYANKTTDIHTYILSILCANWPNSLFVDYVWFKILNGIGYSININTIKQVFYFWYIMCPLQKWFLLNPYPLKSASLWCVCFETFALGIVHRSNCGIWPVKLKVNNKGRFMFLLSTNHVELWHGILWIVAWIIIQKSVTSWSFDYMITVSAMGLFGVARIRQHAWNC